MIKNKKLIIVMVILASISVSLVSITNRNSYAGTSSQQNIAGKYVDVDLELLNGSFLDINKYKTHKSSLNINIPNIDLDDIESNIPVDKVNLEELKKHNSKLLLKKDITHGDYLQEKNKWLIDEEAIHMIAYLYPELSYEKITKMTYGELVDAVYLLKKFYNISSVLKQSDDSLIKLLEDYYKFKIEYVIANENIAIRKELESTQDNFISISEYGDNKATDYISVNVPGYTTDLFLISTRTHVATNHITAGFAAQKLYEIIYNTTNNYIANNMWGTYSISKYQAHEGFDFSGPVLNSNMYAVVKSGLVGQVIDLNDNMGTACYYIDSPYSFEDYTVFYMHSITHTTEATVENGDYVAIESGVGGYPIHLHFSVNKGYNTTYGLYNGDNYNDELYSDNPYMFANYHTNDSYYWY